MNRSKLHKTTVAMKASIEWKRKEETDKLTEGEEGGGRDRQIDRGGGRGGRDRQIDRGGGRGGGGQKETQREGDGRECVRERERGETD